MFITVITFLISFTFSNGLLAPHMSKRFNLKWRGVDIENSVDDLPVIQTNKEDIDSTNPRVTWTAYVKSSTKVKESQRTIEQYMALPASEYSILSANQIERIDDSNFKCTLGTMNFFGTKITPTLFVDVTVYPEEAKSIIAVSRAETTGSETALAVNGTFSISAINTVTAGVDEKDRKIITSETALKIDVLVPSSKLPIKMIQSGGNFIMQSSLNVIVPTFVRILASDFKRWSAGDDSRNAVDGATL